MALHPVGVFQSDLTGELTDQQQQQHIACLREKTKCLVRGNTALNIPVGKFSSHVDRVPVRLAASSEKPRTVKNMEEHYCSHTCNKALQVFLHKWLPFILSSITEL